MTFDFSSYIMPIVLSAAAVIFLVKKDCFAAFADGASDGMRCCIELLPAMLLIMCSVNAMFSSGLADIICKVFSPVLTVIGVPDEMIPTVVLRPFSGSASTSLAHKLFSSSGADSIPSKIACLLMGSTDTLLYTLGMYLSSIKVKKTGYAIPASLIVFVFSVIVCTALGNAVFA